MKQEPNRASPAFSLVDVLVTVVIIIILAALISPFLANRARRQQISWHFTCLNNLKEIGTAYRLWASDNGDLIPSQQTVVSHGWEEFLTNANQGAMCWTNYAIMENELGESPKLVICPADERQAALSFTNKFDNNNVSYFVGVSANFNQPQSILGGDRNLGPGAIPTNDYGYSPKSGNGNDVAIPTNSAKGPVPWSLKMHSMDHTNPLGGAGFILLGDGSAQTTTTASFNNVWLPKATPTTNWPVGHVPATPSIRLVFP
jgi:type II secretory pathway pseudopilin PulG